MNVDTSQSSDLDLVTVELQRLTTDVAGLRAEMHVPTSIALRQGDTSRALPQETRAGLEKMESSHPGAISPRSAS
jgi:hypothetical protein